MLTEERKQRLEKYRKTKAELELKNYKAKKEKERLQYNLKKEMQKIKMNEQKIKNIEDAKDLELIKYLRDEKGDENIEDILLGALGIDKNEINVETEVIQNE